MGLQEKIKSLRSNKGISQKKLADAIGVAQSSINYWEKGQRTPSVAAAQKLADYFNVTLDELYEYDKTFSKMIGEEINKIDDDEPILYELHKLNQNGYNKVLQYTTDMGKIPEYQANIETFETHLKIDKDGNLTD